MPCSRPEADRDWRVGAARPGQGCGDWLPGPRKGFWRVKGGTGRSRPGAETRPGGWAFPVLFGINKTPTIPDLNDTAGRTSHGQDRSRRRSAPNPGTLLYGRPRLPRGSRMDQGRHAETNHRERRVGRQLRLVKNKLEYYLKQTIPCLGPPRALLGSPDRVRHGPLPSDGSSTNGGGTANKPLVAGPGSTYLRRGTQLAEGSAYGRWGMNYITAPGSGDLWGGGALKFDRPAPFRSSPLWGPDDAGKGPNWLASIPETPTGGRGGGRGCCHQCYRYRLDY